MCISKPILFFKYYNIKNDKALSSEKNLVFAYMWQLSSENVSKFKFNLSKLIIEVNILLYLLGPI